MKAIALLGPLLLLVQESDLPKKSIAMQKEVTAIRGLAFNKPVDVGVYSRKELFELLKKERAKKPKGPSVEYKVLLHFGLTRRGKPSEESMGEVVAESLGGFYDPASKQLRLIDDMSAGMKAIAEAREINEVFGYKIDLFHMTLVHELCHAAQDQNYDLETLPVSVDHESDMGLAVRAMIEGEASVVGWKHGLGDSFDTLSSYYIKSYKESPEPAPPKQFIERLLGFPYGHGSEFILKVLGPQPWDWKKVEAVYQDLPGSTEQILHPRRYIGPDRDHPCRVTLETKKAFEGAHLISDDTMGEFGSLLLLEEFDEGNATARRKASEGWDGDRYYVFEDANAVVSSAWFSTWDYEDDADEFFKMYSRILQGKYSLKPVESTPTKMRVEMDKRRVVIERRGTDILVLDNGTVAAEKEWDNLWKSVTKTEIKKVERVKKKQP